MLINSNIAGRSRRPFGLVFELALVFKLVKIFRTESNLCLVDLTRVFVQFEVAIPCLGTLHCVQAATFGTCFRWPGQVRLPAPIVIESSPNYCHSLALVLVFLYYIF